MHMVSRIPFIPAMSLLSQRQHASGPVPAAASPLFIVQQVEAAASCFRTNLDPHTCLGDCSEHNQACTYFEESALKVIVTQQAEIHTAVAHTASVAGVLHRLSVSRTQHSILDEHTQLC